MSPEDRATQDALTAQRKRVAIRGDHLKRAQAAHRDREAASGVDDVDLSLSAVDAARRALEIDEDELRAFEVKARAGRRAVPDEPASP